ncbi:MAG: twin-arginine translocase subunit TatC [Acidobacteriia bacterium]|nr:twin-arginine translocase subunit TatC [Terriglobia bacterium]
MTFLEHLDELRKRLFRCAIVYVAVLSACWYFSPTIVEFLLRPIRRHLFAGGDIVFLRLTEPFMVYMKASAIAALFVAAPYLLHQLWGFVAPGLYRHERLTGVAFLTFGTLFLVLGGLFGYYVATPIAAKWLIQLGSGFKASLTLESAFEFEAWVLLGMGLVFELPIVLYFLGRIGLVTPRFLLRHLRLAIVVCFVISAVITPTGDMLTMSVFALPMVALYLVGVLVIWFTARPRKT